MFLIIWLIVWSKKYWKNAIKNVKTLNVFVFVMFDQKSKTQVYYYNKEKQWILPFWEAATWECVTYFHYFCLKNDIIIQLSK